MGDINVITDTDEKLGGIPYNMRKILQFICLLKHVDSWIWDSMDLNLLGLTKGVLILEFGKDWMRPW